MLQWYENYCFVFILVVIVYINVIKSLKVDLLSCFVRLFAWKFSSHVLMKNIMVGLDVSY